MCLTIAGCASLPRTPYSAADGAQARILDLADLRRYADEPAWRFQSLRDQASPRGPLTYLALSGGGADGAYGAGVLSGWSETGTRPSFSIVSGVSTGALIAPFAFLGPRYDRTLRDVYTSGVAETLLESPNPLNAIFGSGLFGNRNLRGLVAKYIDAQFVSEVAAEYAKGRRLLIVTTNIDSQRAAIWDMGRIASLQTTESLNLFRDVVTASASLPVVFPPILINAEANGRQFQEMHIDGGVTSPVLTLPEAYLLRNASFSKGERLQIYILINNKVDREFHLTDNKTVDIAGRSSSTMVKGLTRSTIASTYEFARRSKFGFSLTYIGDERPISPPGFETAYMRDLFQYGYDKARSNRAWSHAPPADGIDAVPASETVATLPANAAN
jgi:predicted patatin/cPLA2 family phospholipase